MADNFIMFLKKSFTLENQFFSY